MMNLHSINLDWDFLIERIDRLMDLTEEFLTRKLTDDIEADPQIFRTAVAFRWNHDGQLEALEHPDVVRREQLLGLDDHLERLHRNTHQFVAGLPANNILLWGERGAGKSSAVKSLLPAFAEQGLRMIEVHKEELYHLPAITRLLRTQPYRFILFCDDLSFDENEPGYRELKTLLQGGLEAPPPNMLIYATANRRHLMPERLEDNADSTEIHPEEAVAEKLSLSDRFGITLGFYPVDQPQYLGIVRYLARERELNISDEELSQEALRWALARGSRSGRVAHQFVDDLTGRLGLAALSRNRQANDDR